MAAGFPGTVEAVFLRIIVAALRRLQTILLCFSSASALAGWPYFSEGKISNLTLT